MRTKIIKLCLALTVLFAIFIPLGFVSYAQTGDMAFYTFDNNLSDSASNYHAMGYGGYSFVTGVDGQALYLDGSSYITLPPVLENANSTFTLSFWQKADSADACVILDAVYNNQSVMRITMPDHEGIVNWTVGDQLVRRLPEECFYKDSWNFWSFVFDGTQSMKIYINGTIVSSIADVEAAIPAIETIYIGRSASGEYYMGAIDNLLFSEQALTTSQIQALMAGQRASQPQPAVGSSMLQESEGYTLAWKGAEGALSYDVYIAGTSAELDSADTTSNCFIGNVTNTFMVLQSLNENQKYFWRIDSVFSDTVVRGLPWNFTAIQWNPQAYFDLGTKVLAAIEQDFRIRSYDGYFEESSWAWSYAWPNTIQLMALGKAAALHPEMYIPRINNYVLQLDSYRTEVNGIVGYDCLPNPGSTNRFYDDNAWMACGLLDVYAVTQNPDHLSRALDAYNFALSGENSLFGGGILWKETQYAEDPPVMKGISSTAGAAFAALKLYELTGGTQYLADSERLIGWILNTLQDEDGLILNSIDASGINRVKWSYNTGVPISVLTGLYHITENQNYLEQAIRMGKAAAALWLDTDKGAIIDVGCFAFTLYEGWTELYKETQDIYWLELAAASLKYVQENEDGNGRYPLNWNDAVTVPQTYWGLLYTAPVARAYLTAANLGAAEIIPGDVIASETISVTASSEWPGAYAVNTVNLAGMNGVLHDASSTAATMWHTLAGGGGDTNTYPGLPQGPAWIVYNFDAEYAIGRMSVWNFNQLGGTTRGLRNVDVYYSQNGTAWEKLGDYVLPEAAGAENYPYNYQIDFNGVNASAVAIVADAENGSWGDIYYGLSAVRFEYTGVQPYK